MSFRSSKLLVTPVLCLATLCAGIWFGCSANTDEDSSGFAGGNQGPAGSGAAGAASQGGAGGTGGSGEGGIVIAGPGGSGQGGGETCAEKEQLADQKQLDIVVLLDRSGSMIGQNWNGSVAALKTFVNDPASAGINIGIVYFPFDDSAEDCNVDDYKNILSYGQLPANAPPFVQNLDAHQPGGATPMYGGLMGALFAATGLQDANPDHKVIVVFGSDGDPTSCDITDIGQISALAQSALNYNGVQTYVIAINGGNLVSLNQIAAAGGTGTAFDVTSNIMAFSQKMAEIRAAALGCEVDIPPPPEGETFDKDLVNVNYYPGGNMTGTKLPKKDGKADCGSGAGWYYDDPNEPTKIIFCPASCQTIQADTKAKVNVGFGCESIAM